MEVLSPDPAGLARTVELLRAGEVVGFPTDTVYGLAARATDAAAMARIFALKGRSGDRPLVLMLARAVDALAWAEVDQRSGRLMARHWPGPLTLVLPARRAASPLTAGDPPTIGVRVPDHPVALALLAALGEGLATTSANPSGQPPALSAAELAASLPALAAVLDGGRAPGGEPSTVVDLSGDEPRVLRAGPLTALDLRADKL